MIVLTRRKMQISRRGSHNKLDSEERKQSCVCSEGVNCENGISSSSLFFRGRNDHGLLKTASNVQCDPRFSHECRDMTRKFSLMKGSTWVAVPSRDLDFYYFSGFIFFLQPSGFKNNCIGSCFIFQNKKSLQRSIVFQVAMF